MSGNGTASTDEGNNGSLSSNSIDHCVGRLVGLSCAQAWMRKNGHGGKESDEKSISLPNAGSWSVSGQAGEVWIRERSWLRARDEQVMDGALEGGCYDGGDQAVSVVGFFLPLRPPSSQLALPLSFYVPQLQLPFSYLELPHVPSAFGHPTPLKLP